MLAHLYKKHRARLDWSAPIYIQPKLDGIRAIYHNGQLQTRAQELWAPTRLPHIFTGLDGLFPDIVLDGELYHHGYPLGRINSGVAVKSLEPSKHTLDIQYHIFDCFFPSEPHLKFCERNIRLANLYNFAALNYDPHFRLVETKFAFDPVQADTLYNYFISQGYEGIMYRLDEPYGLETECGNQDNRWNRLLKRKGYLDDELPCQGIELGKGKYTTSVGALIFDAADLPSSPPNTPSLPFTVGTGLSDNERTYYTTHPPINKKFTIRYRTLSEYGIPLEPRLISIHND